MLAQIIGALYGLLAIIFGAFGAHRLRKSLSVEQLKSFETGVQYQMYHAILLLILSFNLNLQSPLESNMIYCLIIGTFLFSFSIYGLILGAVNGRKLKFLGPITPIGGLLLIAGWGMLCYFFLQNLI